MTLIPVHTISNHGEHFWLKTKYLLDRFKKDYLVYYGLDHAKVQEYYAAMGVYKQLKPCANMEKPPRLVTLLRNRLT